MSADNLTKKKGNGYTLNFPCFSKEEFESFSKLFLTDESSIDNLITKVIKDIKRSFLEFVPKRLESQINQYISSQVSCVGEVIHELIERGTLERPNDEIPMTNGVFYISGDIMSI